MRYFFDVRQVQHKVKTILNGIRAHPACLLLKHWKGQEYFKVKQSVLEALEQDLLQTIDALDDRCRHLRDTAGELVPHDFLQSMDPLYYVVHPGLLAVHANIGAIS